MKFPALGLVPLTLAGALGACSTQMDAAGSSMASISDSCINPTRIEEQKIVSNEEIQFTLNNDEVWVNRLPRACPGLKSSGGFTWDVSGTLVCSNAQMIRVKDDGTTCQLGVFTRVPAAT